MRIQGFLIGAASLSLIAGTAVAQSTTNTQDPPQSPMATPNSMGATPATTGQGTTTTTTMTTTTIMPAPADSTMVAPAPSTATITTDTSTLPTRMYTSSTGVNVQVVSNGPVPDTPENRAKYGKPMSHAGKRTPPAGN